MKRLFVTIFVLTSAFAAFAQDTTAVQQKPAAKPVNESDYQYDKFNFGLALTPSINWLTPANDYSERDGVKMGFAYGIIGEISFAKRYSFSTGVDISYQGGKLKYNMDTTGVTIMDNYKLNYVSIPLSIKMRTNKITPRTSFFGQFGIVPAINTSAKAIRSYSDGQDDETVKLSDEATDVTIGLRVGLGCEYFLSGDTRAFGGITWNQGFTQVLKSDFDSKANYIALQIGVFF